MAELNDLDVAAANNNFSPATGGWPEGMSASNVNNAAREDLAIIARGYRDQRGSLVSAGTANAQTLTPNATHAAYYDGMTFTFRAGAGLTNTGATTINVASIGARNVFKANPSAGTMTALEAGDIIAGGVYRIVYDNANTRFVLMNPGRLVRDQIVLDSTTAYALASTTHAYQAGLASGFNVVGDTSGFQGRNNGSAADLELQRVGGGVTVGPPASAHAYYGPAGIQGLNGVSAATLALQAGGGNVSMGGSLTTVGSVAVGGNLSATGGAITGATVATTSTITAGGVINADAGISAGGTIATDTGQDISSGGNLDCTDDMTVGNDLTVLNDADVTGTLTAGALEGELHAGFRHSIIVGTGTASAAQINGILDLDAGITVTLPDFAGGAALGSWAIATNTSGGADAAIAAATTLTGDGTISDGEAGLFICHGDGLWLRVS